MATHGSRFLLFNLKVEDRAFWSGVYRCQWVEVLYVFSLKLYCNCLVTICKMNANKCPNTVEWLLNGTDMGMLWMFFLARRMKCMYEF